MTENVIKKANSISKMSGKEHEESFNKIEPYLFELRNLYPGLHNKIDRAPDSSLFQRLIIIPHYAIHVPCSWIGLCAYECHHRFPCNRN